MNEHALSVLEFPEVLRAVAARAASEMGRETILALRPRDGLDRVRGELERVQAALFLLEEHAEWGPPTPPDARSGLKRLGVEGAVLDPVELLLLGRLLTASRTLAGDLGRLAAGSSLDPLAQRLPTERTLEERVEEVVDEDARVRDGASPELRRIRRSLTGARNRIVKRLESLLESLPARIRVPDASVSVRDGRYVIPIRREGKSAVGGVILGESATGATLFVEPPVASGLMNELLSLQRDEEAEVQRILRELTGRLRPRAAELRGGFRALVEFDTLWARALTARDWEASMPILTEVADASEEDRIVVVQGRHPLLLEGPETVVPFDLVLEGEERAMVVSGPNTGGKTVLLKAIGLLFLCAQSGILPPAGPRTRLPMIRRLYADIGDQQSIAESLSTFSAHLARAREILEGAGSGTLVLMDELGTGTDPSEGAALARALLETLVARGARAVVTSHLGALKRLDSEGSGIVNASLRFDSDRMEPTYELLKGRPGRSYGLAIARRLGFPGEVLDRAEELVDSGELDLERLLEALEGKERELSRSLAEAEEEREVAIRRRREAEERATRAEERERKLEARAREEARRLLLEARGEVEDAIRGVQEAGEEERDQAAREARSRVEAAAREQRRRTPDARPRREREGSTQPVQEGDRVRMKEGGARGRVREVRDDRVQVEVGGLRLELPAHAVEVVEEGPAERPESRGSRTPSPSAARWTEVEARPEADLRGLRVEEVELELGRALDGAIMAALPELRIIHGKGTGAVKARVQELLRSDGRVREFRGARPQEGGGGVTVALLEGAAGTPGAGRGSR